MAATELVKLNETERVTCFLWWAREKVNAVFLGKGQFALLASAMD